MRFNTEWTVWEFGISFGKIPAEFVLIYWFFSFSLGPFRVTIRTKGVVNQKIKETVW